MADQTITLPYPTFVADTIAYSAQVTGDLAEITSKFNAHTHGKVAIVTDAPYGAAGDGVTNDTAAIQAAITAMAAVGGVVYIPRGVYKVTNLELPSYTRIEGVDPNFTGGTLGSVISSSDVTKDVISVTPADGSYRTGITLKNLFISGGKNGFASYHGINFLTLDHVEISGAAQAQFYSEGWLEEVLFDMVRLVNGQYGFRMAHVTNPTSGGTNYLDKATFRHVYAAGASVNGWRLEAAVFNAVTWDQCNITFAGQHGFYMDGGARGLTFNQLSTESNGTTGKKNRTTGSITSGTPTLVVASATGYAIGDVVTVKGAKGYQGDLTANVTNVAGTTITLDANATATVASVAVTNAKWDDMYFASTIAFPAEIAIIGGVIGGEAGSGRLRYAINAAGALELTLIAADILIPVYDPARAVNVIGGTVGLRRPPLWNGHPMIGIVAPTDGQGEGGGGFLGTPGGEDFTFALRDSVGNGSGTLGKWSWRVGDTNRTEIMSLDGTTTDLILSAGYLQAYNGIKFRNGGLRPILSGGTASPEGVVTGPPGSVFLRADGAAGTTVYFKETGTGNTGWVARGTFNGLTISDATDIVIAATTGTKIGQASSKIGFFGATPVVQPVSTSDLRTLLINLGLLASGGATPLNLNGGALTAAAITASGVLTAQTALIEKRVTITYATTMPTDAATGNEFVITATDGVAFTISNPTNPADGQRITYTIRNTSGGALGAVTWGVAFKLATWTSPATANSRSITFRYDGTNWVEIGRTPADVPN